MSLNLEKVVGDLVDSVALLEQASKHETNFENVAETNPEAQKENMAKRQMLIDDLVSGFRKIYGEGGKDIETQLAFMAETRKYLQTSGLAELNQLYLLAKRSNRQDVMELLGKVYNTLVNNFENRVVGPTAAGQEVLQTTAATRAGVKDSVRKTMKKGGLELDEKTRKELGFARVTPDTFAKRSGKKQAWPIGKTWEKRISR